MPVYQYECAGCQQAQEALRPLSDRDRPETCAQCGGPAPRVFRPQAVQVVVPAGFRKHIHTTGLRDQLGPGPWEELARNRSRWNAGPGSRTRP